VELAEACMISHWLMSTHPRIVAAPMQKSESGRCISSYETTEAKSPGQNPKVFWIDENSLSVFGQLFLTDRRV
jgi:hypothetical protein